MIQDDKIIELFFERSEHAIRELDAKYGKACFKLSYNITGNRQDAEECINDSYLGVWNAIPPAKPDSLLAFVLGVVRNQSIKAYWKSNAEKRNSNCSVAMQEVEDILAASNSVEHSIEAYELAQMLQRFLDMQTVENRVIFLRRYWFSDTYRDIAEQTGLSEKVVSVRLARIRKKLKEFLIKGGLL